MAPMTASARSPATSHTSPRRIQDPNPLFGCAPCDSCSVWRGGTLLCMLLPPCYRRVSALTSPARVAELRHPELLIEDEARPRTSTLRPRRWRFSESPHSPCRG